MLVLNDNVDREWRQWLWIALITCGSALLPLVAYGEGMVNGTAELKETRPATYGYIYRPVRWYTSGESYYHLKSTTTAIERCTQIKGSGATLNGWYKNGSLGFYLCYGKYNPYNNSAYIYAGCPSNFIGINNSSGDTISCRSVSKQYACPDATWSLVGTNCEKVTPAGCPLNATGPTTGVDGQSICTCNDGYSPSNGQCVPTDEQKESGTPHCTAAEREAGSSPTSGSAWQFNPINAGTGGKAQVEAIYSGSGIFPLRYRLHYTSRKAGSTYALAVGQGASWHHEYGRRVMPDASGTASVAPGTVTVRRADGRQYLFTRQADGSYLPDADIVERLTRLTDATGVTTGWQVVAGGDETETYDTSGKLVQLRTRSGMLQTLSYDGTGRLATVTDAFGRAMTFAYDTQNRIVTLTPPDNGVITFAYDGAGNLAGVTWPDGKSRSYHYEDTRFPNNLTGITDENGVRYATWAYDDQGRAISSEHAGGADRGTLSYGVGNTTVTDALGASRTISFTTILDVVRSTGQTQPGGAGCGPSASAINYDANGNVASRTDYNGVTTTYTYDLSRNLETQRVEAAGTPQARTIRTEWHASFRLPVRVSEPLKLTTYAYDAQGNRISRSEQATNDADGSAGFAAQPVGPARTWTLTYNSVGQVLTQDGPLPGMGDTTTITYHPADDPDLGKRGQVATITNALGHVIRFDAYDANGRPLSVRDPNGVVTTLSYDARGRLTSRRIGDETTSYQYDGVGQLRKVSFADGSYLAYTYDGAHRLTEVADGQGNRITYTLDAAGNRLADEVRDPQGQLVQLRHRAFDILGRLAQETGAAGQATSYAYDANGNLTRLTDPLGRITSRSHDALNRLVTVTDPAGGVTGYTHDGRDQLTQVTDPRGLMTRYTVDGLGQETALNSPDTGTSSRSYDAAGRLQSRTDAKGQTTQYQYDALSRLTAAIHHDGSRVLYTYDVGANAVGRLSQVEERAADDRVMGSQQYAYDSLGRVVTDTRLVGPAVLTTGYQYSLGRLIGVTYPSGREVRYEHDAAGRISRITLHDNGTATVLADLVTYQPFGGPKNYTNGDGQPVSRTYDLDGRISTYSLGGETWTLSYDAAARIVGQEVPAIPGKSGVYGYDSLDRLVSAALPSTAYGYSYDAVGNRTGKTVGATASSYGIASDSNRLLTIGGSEMRSYQYDANGSPVSDGVTAFAYDARGRLVGVTTPQGSTSYTVNALGQRVQKSGAGGTTLYVYDLAGRLLAEAEVDGTIRREYVWMDELPLAILQ